MPELPEVETVRRSLEPRLLGDRVEHVEVRFPTLREPLDGHRLHVDTVGGKVVALRRRAKYLLIDLQHAQRNGTTLVIHLGMSGRLTLVPAEDALEPHEHVAWYLESGRRLRLRDPRRFGLAFSLPTEGLETDRHFAHLGVEPLDGTLGNFEGGNFDGAYLRNAACGRRGPVKTFLMDGTVVVGVGNIYVAEALWRAGVHPKRSVARVGAGTWDRLADACRDVLAQAVEEGGTTLNDFTDAAGQAGYFQVSLDVYGREGEPCNRCRRAVRRIVQSNRSTFYCPGCQR